MRNAATQPRDIRNTWSMTCGAQPARRLTRWKRLTIATQVTSKFSWTLTLALFKVHSKASDTSATDSRPRLTCVALTPAFLNITPPSTSGLLHHHGDFFTIRASGRDSDHSASPDAGICIWSRQHRVNLQDRRPQLAPWRHRGYACYGRLLERSQMEVEHDQARLLWQLAKRLFASACAYTSYICRDYLL
jgi:hypothetical protein